MPHGEPDPSDPSMLCGVSLPGSEETTREMARVFAEEFARAGLGEAQIKALFRDPFYGAAHRAFLLIGPEEIDAMVAESAAVWGRVRLVDRVPLARGRPEGGEPRNGGE